MSDRRLEVAVWWPGEGYGLGRAVDDETEAHEAADRLRRMGYGPNSNTQIHMIETVRTITRLVTKEAKSDE